MLVEMMEVRKRNGATLGEKHLKETNRSSPCFIKEETTSQQIRLSQMIVLNMVVTTVLVKSLVASQTDTRSFF